VTEEVDHESEDTPAELGRSGFRRPLPDPAGKCNGPIHRVPFSFLGWQICRWKGERASRKSDWGIAIPRMSHVE